MGPCFDKPLQTVVTNTTTGAGFHGNKDSDIYILLKLVCDTTIEGFFYYYFGRSFREHLWTFSLVSCLKQEILQLTLKEKTNF